MSYVKVIDVVHVSVTREGDPNERWDGDDTYESHHIKGIKVVDEGSYYDFVAAFDVDPSKTYYLLYTIYSTGNSFSHEEGKIQFVDLFETLEKAQKNLKRIEEHNKTYKKLNDRWARPSKEEQRELNKLKKTFDEWSVRLVTESGREYDFHVPWHGYFERLTTVEIEPVLVR